MKTIWCLFSIANDYNQPRNNLVVWWSDKPSFAQLSDALSIPFPNPDDARTLFVVHLWEGCTGRCMETDYRLEEVEEGKLA